LDVGGADDKGGDFSFAFDELGDEPAASIQPPVEEPPVDHSIIASMHDAAAEAAEPEEGGEDLFGGDAALGDGQADSSANEIPLAVFPPPDTEAAGSEILIGTGRSGIISMTEAADDQADDDFADGHFADDDFDDKDIAHELGLADVEGEPLAAETHEPGGDFEQSPEFGEPAGHPFSEDVSFDAAMTGGEFPFADSEQVEPSAHDIESGTESGLETGQDDPASIPLTAAVAAAGAAVAAAKPGAKPSSPRKKGGGLGQMVGVVLGGLMALPITYAILIWGFHKDPFKFGKKAPPQLAFLLPQKLQPGYKPPRKAEPVPPGLEGAPSLDDLPAVDEAAVQEADQPAETDVAEPATGQPAEPADEPMALADTATEPAEALNPVASTEPAEPAEPAESGEPATEAASESVADAGASSPAMASAPGLGALPPSDALPGLDALLIDADATAVPAPAVAAAALPPLDLSGVDAAAEQAAQAFEALEAISDPADPARDRLLVGWYKRLAQLGEELVSLETIAADSGRPLSQTPAAAAALFERICGSDTAMADLDRLGRMWLTKQKQRADGVALLATLDGSRQVGPYWSTRAFVSGANADGTDRSIAIISRLPPPADAGARVVVSGVMFDGDAVWAADVRPVEPQPQADVGQE
jgi:hypothetical protein